MHVFDVKLKSAPLFGIHSDFAPFAHVSVPVLAIKMAARAQAEASGSAEGVIAPFISVQERVARIEASLVATFTHAALKQETIAKLADAGITSTPLFVNICSSPDELRAFLKDGVGMNLTDYKGDFLEAAKVLGAWEEAKLTRTTVAKKQAEQRAEFQTPQIRLEDYEEARELFEKSEYELEDSQAPSKAYLERKLAEASSTFRAEPLTAVTTASQEDNNQTTIPVIDPHSGIFKISSKSFAVQYPRDSEELRLRLRTLGYCWCMMRQHCPNRAVLQTVSLGLVDRYIDWLFGPKAWGLVVRDLKGAAISSPTIEHVMCYDLALRKEVCKQMNNGVDFATALAAAQINQEIRHHNFLAQVTIASASSGSRAVTAPGVRAAASSGDGNNKRKNTDDGLSAAQKKRARKQERQRAALTENRNNAAAHNPSPKGTPKGGKNAKGEGKGKNGKNAKGSGWNLPAGAKTETPDGTPICVNWNQRKTCKRDPCNFKHVCYICLKGDHMGCDHRYSQS